MATSVRRESRPPPVFVNLYCSQCDNHLGIFENEWARLTSSYMRPTLPGQHFASEIAQKTQIVPNGVVGQTAEGCTMAEVFCKKCSVAVAQYCKAAPRPDQGKLVNQYFYKSSRTYLRTSDNKFQVDPIFAFSGDLKASSGRFSVPPRPKMSSVHRMSQTPLRSEYTPSRVQPSSQSHLHRISSGHGLSQTPLRSEYTPSRVQPSPQSHLHGRQSLLSQTQTHTEPEESFALRLAAQEERLRHQEEKMVGQDQRSQEQEARIQALYEKLDDFREILEGYKVKIGDLQAQATAGTPSFQQLDQPLFVSNLEQLIATSKNAYSISGEIERLRAENKTLKMKLDSLNPPAGLPTAEMGGSHALGKRKRNSDVSRSSQSQLKGIDIDLPATGYHDQASFRPILTPQSSIASASGSQASEREYIGVTLHLGLTDTGSSGVVNNDDESNPVGSDFQGVADVHDHAREHATYQARDETLLSEENARVATEPSTTAQSAQPTNTKSISQLEHIDFSDDEHPSEPPARRLRSNSSAGGITQSSVPAETRGADTRTKRALRNSQGNDVARPEPEPEPETEPQTTFKRPRRVQRSTSRRVTDYEVDYNGRNNSRSLAPSVAPQSVVRRRTLPPKPIIETPGGMEHVQIVTPTSHEEEMNADKQPRPEREIVQSTEKILQLELIELGLEEWIGCKDKSTNVEYRKAVDAARNQRREKKKREALASVGLNISPSSQEKEEANGPLDSTLNGAVDKVAESSGETTMQTAQTTAQAVSMEMNTSTIDDTGTDAFAEKDVGVMTRRKQRKREEIRRLDRLAREALEMDF